MKREASTESIRVGSKVVAIEPTAFKSDNGRIDIVPSLVDTTDASDYLVNCHSTKVGDGILIRSGRIDTDLKLKCLLRLVESLWQRDKKWRLCCCQLEDAENHWDAISEQNRHLILANKQGIPNSQLVHLNTPFFHFLHHPPDEKMIAPVRDRIKHLPLQINMEALAQYCAWVYNDIKKVYDEFLLDAIDEYRLEARIIDFKNEVTSIFLKHKIDGMKELFKRQEAAKSGEKKQTDDEIFEMEQQLIILRDGIKKTLQIRYSYLDEMMWLIDLTKDAHPELTPVGEKILLLKTVLGSESDVEGFTPRGWVEQLMLIHLLNRRLQVVTAMNCAEGGHQTNFAFAFCLAVASMDEELNSREFLELIVNWDARTKAFNKKIAMQVLTPKIAREDPLIPRLRQRVYSVLRQHVVGAGDYQIEKGMIQDPDFLNLLPSSLKSSDGKVVRLVEYNEETGVPIRLTFAADRHFTNFVV